MAQRQLMALFPSIRFEEEEETEPFLLSNRAKFINQVARFDSCEGAESVRQHLKEIERMAGRLPGHKAEERVLLDIDLLQVDNEILKPEEMERDYIKNKLRMKYLAIIPARYASTRFPAKPLAMLGGKPMIQRVYEQVKEVFGDVYVATDDTRIEKAVEAFGGKVVMTSVDHNSGTDRCFEAFCKIGGVFDVVVNVQGDEPFIQPSQLQTIKQCFDDPATDIATLVKPFAAGDAFEALANPNSPKVVVSTNMTALYFSRSVVPYCRNAEPSDWLKRHVYYKHIGLYAYRAEVLKAITSLPQSSLELAESLEQLRWIENGYTIKVGITEIETIGIDTPEDLEKAEHYLKQTSL